MIRVFLHYVWSWFLLLRYYFSYRRVYEKILREEGEQQARNYVLHLKQQWGRDVIRSLNLRLQCKDESDVEEGERVVYVCNHQGLIDIPVLYTCLPLNVAFIAKKELFSLPFIGYWITKAGCVSLDRSSPRKGMESIKTAVRAMSEGMNMVIFPEGTRTKDPSGAVAPFKQGSLKLPLLGNAKIVPVMIEGTRHIFDTSYNKKDITVFVHIGKKIDPSQMSREEQKKLAAMVHQWVVQQRDALVSQEEAIL